MKSRIIFSIACVLFLLGIILIGLNAEQLSLGKPKLTGTDLLPQAERMRRIGTQQNLIDEGMKLVDGGHYDEAIEKYETAMAPDLLLKPWDVDPPKLYMSRALKIQGKYQEALDLLNEVMNRIPGAKDGLKEMQRLELQALIKARDKNSPQPIYDHIQYLRKKYKDQLPPKTCIGYCSNIFSAIARLYDHIGDYDGGITFTDEFIQFYAKRWRVAVNKLEDPHSKNQYYLIKKEFLQDKAEGRKSCINAQPGEACMGRATKALIQSNYFPW